MIYSHSYEVTRGVSFITREWITRKHSATLGILARLLDDLQEMISLTNVKDSLSYYGIDHYNT